MSMPTSLQYDKAAPPDPAQMPSRVQLLMLVNAKWIAQSISVAAKLGVADVLADGPKTIAELAEATGCKSRPLYRVLRAIAAVGVFAELPDGRFVLTALAEYLRTDEPETIRHAAIMMGADFSWRPYGQMLHALRTGGTAFERVFGRRWFAYLEQHPSLQDLFDTAMTELAADSARAIAEDFDFSRFPVVADLGGGHGQLIASIVTEHPGVTGILFDQPHVVSGATALLRRMGVEDRVRQVGGDFFHEVPSDADVYLMRKCLHDWDDDRCVAILRNIRTAIGDRRDARVLIVEAVLAPGNEWDLGKMLDIEMMVNIGGQERTEDEWRRLLDRAGFRLVGTVQTAPLLGIVEAEPV